MKTHKLLQILEQDFIKTGMPEVSIGDTIKVGVLIQEGNKQRIQPYQGIVIAQHKGSFSSSITVRKVFQGVGVERVFPKHSPSIKNIDVTRQSKVRKSKLYYLRDRVGKSARLKQKNF